MDYLRREVERIREELEPAELTPPSYVSLDNPQQ